MILESTWSAEAGLYSEAGLRSLGITHGVTGRELGNMREEGSRAAAVRAVGWKGAGPLLLRQTHGTSIHEPRSAGEEAQPPEGDGWVCAEPGRLCAVFVADCLPIFVWDRGARAVGVLHAGWRGLAAGMPRAGVRAFKRFGIGPQGLQAAIGPHIGACCYRVGPEVAARFRPEATREGRLDLGEEARRQLVESGLDAARILMSRSCTCCGEGFYSFRRDKRDLRMMAFIGLPGERV